jgi:hypothetical protein
MRRRAWYDDGTVRHCRTHFTGSGRGKYGPQLSIHLFASPPSKQRRAAIDARWNFPGRKFVIGVLHRPPQQPCNILLCPIRRDCCCKRGLAIMSAILVLNDQMTQSGGVLILDEKFCGCFVLGAVRRRDAPGLSYFGHDLPLMHVPPHGHPPNLGGADLKVSNAFAASVPL